MFEGNLEEGELEIGQIAASFEKIQSAIEIVQEIWEEYQLEVQKIKNGEINQVRTLNRGKKKCPQVYLWTFFIIINEYHLNVVLQHLMFFA